MSDQIAYALRAEYEDTYTGANIACNDSTIDVLQELKDGKGQIVVDASDHVRVQILDEHPPLKRVAVKQKKAAAKAEAPTTASKDA